MAASPFILVFCPVFKSKTAHITVIGKTKTILLVKLNIAAIAIAPKAICERPSPIKENLFKTSVTPNKDEHKAISTPTIKAYLTKGYWKYKVN